MELVHKTAPRGCLAGLGVLVVAAAGELIQEATAAAGVGALLSLILVLLLCVEVIAGRIVLVVAAHGLVDEIHCVKGVTVGRFRCGKVWFVGETQEGL